MKAFSVLVSIALLICPVSASARSAREIIDATGVRGGLVVHLGCGDGKLTATLRVSDSYLVHGLDVDAGDIEKARRHIRSLGLCGKVSAAKWTGLRLPYMDNLANLVVADELGGIRMAEVMRVLAPLGVAYIKSFGPLNDPEALDGRNGTWQKTVKPWPAEIDEWTHYLHGADGNPVANDNVVGPPRHQQWVSGPRWLRSHETVSSVATIVTAAGRLFYIVDEAPISLPGLHELPDKWALVARDAFNGVKLWKVPIGRWGWREWKTSWFSPRPGDYPFNIQKRLVAVGDRVYVTLGYHAPLSELDARTGAVLKTYEGTEETVEFLYADGSAELAEVGVLVCSVLRGEGLRLTAVDSRRGKRLWTTRETYKGVTTDYLRWRAMRGAIKRPAKLTPTLNTATDGRTVAFLDGNAVTAVSFKDGTQKWRVQFPEKGPKSPVKGLSVNGLWVGTTIVKDGCVLHASPSTLACFSASDGKLKWTRPKRYLGHLWYAWKDVFVIDGLVWTWSDRLLREPLSAGGGAPAGKKTSGRSSWPETVNGYDLRTGKLEKKVDLGKVFKTHHHHRCYRNKATVRYILASRRGTEYVDLHGGTHTVHNWVRGTCHVGMMPANGLHYAPPHPCVCYSQEKLNGMNALAAALSPEPGAAPEGPGHALERGRAYGLVEGAPPDAEDWPTYRHDIGRSGSVKTKLSADIEMAWRVQLGGARPTVGGPPVCVADRLFVPLVDCHRIVALDATNGERLWEFAAGARIDSPPTYFRGALIFGSRDGWVYSVRATDGALAWRFRAAPRERLVGAFGQLESAWPVHGSVLVLGGVAYFAAGRSSYLDGGLYLYGVDAVTGEVRHRARLEGPDYTADNIKQNYRLPMGTLPDVMQSDGSSVFMRDVAFDPRLGRLRGVPKLRVGGGFLDDTYFKRVPWRHPNCGYGRLIVYDDECAYCVRMFDSLQGLNPNVYFTPGKKGYLLTAQETTKRNTRWSHRVRIRIRAMVAADGVLCVAGPPDVVEARDPLGAFEGRKGGVLRLIDSRTGEKVAEHGLPSPPVFNGAAAARGRLFLCLEDGSVACFAK